MCCRNQSSLSRAVLVCNIILHTQAVVLNSNKTKADGLLLLAHRRRSAILTCAPLTAMLKRLLKVRM